MPYIQLDQFRDMNNNKQVSHNVNTGKNAVKEKNKMIC